MSMVLRCSTVTYGCNVQVFPFFVHVSTYLWPYSVYKCLCWLIDVNKIKKESSVCYSEKLTESVIPLIQSYTILLYLQYGLYHINKMFAWAVKYLHNCLNCIINTFNYIMWLVCKSNYCSVALI